MDHHKPTRSAPRNRASLIVLIVLAFLLMAAAVVLVVSLPDNSAWQDSTETSEALDIAGTGFSCEAAEAQQFYPFGTGVMKMTGTRIAMLDIQGIESFGVDVTYTAPFCVKNDTYFLAADRNGHTFVMLDASRELFRGSLNGRISGASISPDGYLALVQDQNNSTGVISIFAPVSGEKLFDCYFPESGYALSVSFPPEGGCFDVALINTSASTAKPIVNRYSLKGEQLGQWRPELSDLFPLIEYDADQNPVLCGAASCAAISSENGQVLWQKNYPQILAARTASEGLLVLAADRMDGSCSLFTVKADGESGNGLAIGDAITNLAVLDSFAAMGSGTRVVVVDTETAKVIIDQEMKAEVIRVGFADAKTLTIVTRTGVRRLSID